MRIASLVAVAFVALTGRASAETFAIDQTNATITFTAPFMEVFELAGQFHDFNGRAELDDADPTAARTEMTVETSALSTDDGRWEDRLRGPDFFDSEEFPELTFRSTAFDEDKDGQGTLTGQLSMRGVTRMVSFAIEYEVHRVKGRKAWLAFHGTTTLDRRDFGITAWEGVLGDTVTIEITADAAAELPAQN
jgi:polyisoprenoid-binding protein YceI